MDLGRNFFFGFNRAALDVKGNLFYGKICICFELQATFIYCSALSPNGVMSRAVKIFLGVSELSTRNSNETKTR